MWTPKETISGTLTGVRLLLCMHEGHHAILSQNVTTGNRTQSVNFSTDILSIFISKEHVASELRQQHILPVDQLVMDCDRKILVKDNYWSNGLPVGQYFKGIIISGMFGSRDLNNAVCWFFNFKLPLHTLECLSWIISTTCNIIIMKLHYTEYRGLETRNFKVFKTCSV